MLPLFTIFPDAVIELEQFVTSFDFKHIFFYFDLNICIKKKNVSIRDCCKTNVTITGENKKNRKRNICLYKIGTTSCAVELNLFLSSQLQKRHGWHLNFIILSCKQMKCFPAVHSTGLRLYICIFIQFHSLILIWSIFFRFIFMF